MPEEVSHEPKIAERLTSVPHIIEATPRGILQSTEKTYVGDFHDRLEQGMNTSVAKLKTKFLRDINYDENPELYETVENEVEIIADIVFGPLRIGKLGLNTEKLKIPEREISARIQHAITHAIYFSGTPEASENYARSIYDLTKLGRRLALRPELETTQLASSWRGIQNELACVRALKRGGYDVYLPDFTQNTAILDDPMENEVLQLDVASGIDMIAVREGRGFLLDAKGRSNVLGAIKQDRAKERIHPLLLMPEKISFDEIKNPCVINSLKQIRERSKLNLADLYSMTLMIPGASENFRSAELPDKPSDPKTHLAQFGRLDDMQERTVLWRLGHPEQKGRVEDLVQFALMNDIGLAV